MPLSRKLPALFALTALFLITFQVCDTRGAGLTYVDYFETDRGTYEVGQNVNVTAAWYIEYDYYARYIEYSWVKIFFVRGPSCLASEEWLNETDGYHVHQSVFLLNPNAWNPGQEGENGAAECSFSMEPDGGSGYWIKNFMVVRARQNCTLIKVLPSHLTANASAVSLFLRVYNRNNSSFGVGANRIYFDITDPYGQFAVRNSTCLSNPDGNFTVSFDPSFVYGAYHVSLSSAESGKYVEGLFNYTLSIERSPIPTNLSVEWYYAGNMYNFSTSYALESARITAKLTDSLHGAGINDQELNIKFLDSSNLETVCQMKETTNASGFATSTFAIPYEGEFILEVSYDGLSNAWSPAFEKPAKLFKAKSRELSVVELLRLPPMVTLNHSYPVKYLILDSLSKKPVPSVEVTVKANDSILAQGTADDDGVVEFSLHFPYDRLDLVGNTSLSVEASSKLSKQIFHTGILGASLFCRIPTFIRLKVSSQNVLEGGETVVISSELMSSNHTPIPSQKIRFTILANQGENPHDTIVMVTGPRGTCSISLKLLEHGVVTIMARFDGNSSFDSSNDTYSLSVLPPFQERLSSSITSVASAGLLSTILLLATERIRRKAKWQDVSVT